MKITIYRTPAVDPAILAEIPSAVIVHEDRNREGLTWEVSDGFLLVYKAKTDNAGKLYSNLTWGYPREAIDRFEVET